MGRDEILNLFEYNYWANERILAAVDKVSHEQFVAPADHSWGGLRGTLVHGWNAEWIWRMRCQEQIFPQAFVAESEFPTLAVLRTRWQEEEAQMRAWLVSLSDETLNAPCSYEAFNHAPYSHPLWKILVHVVNHGTQHRAECAAMLTQLGYSPGNIDLIIWLRETGQ